MLKAIVAGLLFSGSVVVPAVAGGVAQARCVGATETQIVGNGATEAARGGTCNSSNTYSGAFRRSSGIQTIFIRHSGYNSGSNFDTNTTMSSSFQNALLATDTNFSGFLANCVAAPPNGQCDAAAVNRGF